MNQITGYLLTWRFCTLLIHFVISIAIFYTKIDFVQVQIGKVANNAEAARKYDAGNTRIMSTWAFSLLCFILEFFGAFQGITIFNNHLNLTYILLHSLGALLTLWQILEAWSVDAYLLIFFLFSFLPALIELAWLLFYLFFKLNIFKYIEIRV